MNKLLLSFSLLLCLSHAQGIAQKAGDVRWSRLTNPSSGPDVINSIKVQSGGKLVVAGNGYVGRFVGRLLDSSFGTNGIATMSPNTGANDMGIEQDGKIVVAGIYQKGSAAADFMLARFNQDGTADSSFGTNGIVRTDISSALSDVATAMAIQTDGRIVAAGQSGSSLAVCRYNTDGSPDSSFGTDGRFIATTPGATCMKLQTDGKIVVGCGGTVIRLYPDGSLDYSFGTNAKAALNLSSNDMAIQNDGKILFSASNNFALQRLDTAGIIDNNFGNGGIVTTTGFPYGYYYPRSTSVLLQADGRILASGWVQTSMSIGRNFAVARYQTNGAPDNSFGVNGMVDTDIKDFISAFSYTAIIDNNGELVLAGNETSNPFDGTWAMASYYLGPMLAVPTVPGLTSQIIIAPNPAEDFARIQSTHIENGTWHLSLCDLTGRTLSSETVVVRNNELDKNISLIGLPAAQYLLKLDNGISRMSVKLAKSR